MKVLVTGGAGFIGSHCVDALVAKGHEVTVLDDLSTGSEANLEAARKVAASQGRKVELIRDSVANLDLWAKMPAFDALFHLAAQTSVTASVAKPEFDFSVNINCIPAMLQWIQRSKLRFVVYANTAGAMYGEALSFPTDERSTVAPLAPYGATKSFFETYLGSVTRSRKASGDWSSDPNAPSYFSWISLRLANIYGPRQVPKGEAGVIPIFVEKLAQGETPTIFGDGNKIRDYVYVTDVARAFMAALDKLQQVSIDDAFNVSTATDTRDIEVFDAVLDALHERARRPGAEGEKAKKSLNVKEPRFAPVRAGEVKRSSLSNFKIQSFLNWRPERSFQEGVFETVLGYPL
jgi:UDP-glucose 4-epimerase